MKNSLRVKGQQNVSAYPSVPFLLVKGCIISIQKGGKENER